MKSAYFQCVGGASGDMVLGAAVDVGVRISDISQALDKLNVKGFSLSAEPGLRGGLGGTIVNVELSDEGKRARRFSDFMEIVQSSGLSDNTIRKSCDIFKRLQEAELQVHGAKDDDPKLHELGELDTLVDVVGSVVALELLEVSQVYSSPMPSGTGVIQTVHGMVPATAPATAALFAISGAPITMPPNGVSETGEMVTPTGAAILTTLATFEQPSMNINCIGYGLGSRNPQQYPNALGLWIGDNTNDNQTNNLSVIETNIDDMSGEILGYVQEKLFLLGARDVWFTPIQMKKNRPGTMLSAIVSSVIESQAIKLILTETTTLGVRTRPLVRYEAERDIVYVKSTIGRVPVKVKRFEGRNILASPEYDACRIIALERNMPIQEVYRIVQREADDQLLKI